jgi:hypothetical protein
MSRNLIFHPLLGDVGANAGTYACTFPSVRAWKVLRNEVKNRGYLIFGRRMSDPDDVSTKEGPLYLDIATNMDCDEFLQLAELYQT